VETIRHASYPKCSPRIDIILSAGRAGFDATEDELYTEQNLMLGILDILTEKLSHLGPISTHLISSAGGIFEGAACVNPSTPVSPKRPYGVAKQRLEEELIKRQPDNHSLYIYRPSTIYGYAGPKARHGLITVLLQNAVSNRTTHIFADPNTLRDYVSRDDIAAFVWKQIHNSAPGVFSYILASGKPTSIVEILNNCELVVNRAIWVSYSAQLQNSTNITFSKSCIASEFNTSRLIDGITNTYMNIQNFIPRRDRIFL
jgi:UDP-glucose 4-epimerase